MRTLSLSVGRVRETDTSGIFTESARLPPGVTEADSELFSQARAAGGALQAPEEIPAPPPHVPGTPALSLAPQRCPAAIEFGQWEIETWYSSPFPQEYAR